MKHFIIFALQHPTTKNRWIGLTNDIKTEIRNLRSIVEHRAKYQNIFSTIFWSDVYHFDELIIVILFKSSNYSDAQTYYRNYLKTNKPSYNVKNMEGFQNEATKIS